MPTQLKNPNIKLHAPFTGANNATTAKDYSRSNRTLTFSGAAKISTDQSYYNGGSSLYCDGTNNCCVTVPNSADFHFSDEDFSIEITVMPTAVGQSSMTRIIEKATNGADTSPWIIGQNNGTYNLALYMAGSSQGDILNGVAVGTMVANTWNRLRLCKMGNLVFFYIDDVQTYAASISQVKLYEAATTVLIGGGFNYANTHFTGYIQDVLITRGSPRNRHKFYDATLDPAETTVNVDALIVGGGGSGGTYCGGGGGGGGVRYITGHQLKTGRHSIIVGNGGPNTSGTVTGNDGFSSAFDNIVSVYGGGGGAYSSMVGRAGASSGGTGHTASTPPAGIPGQGNAGGNVGPNNNSGGGGGAGEPGQVGQTSLGGKGGDGVPCSITGSEVYYGGGGGAWSNNSSPNAEGGLGGGGRGGTNGNAITPLAGTPNTGGGGGGSHQASTTNGGGSGVVIIRYLTGACTATGGVITTDGSYTIHTFNSSGIFMVDNPLKAAWKFGDYGVYDAIGNNTLTNSGVAFTTVGLQGYKTASFDGSDYLLATRTSDISIAGKTNFTISTWVKTASTGDKDIILYSQEFDGTHELLFYTSGASNTIVFYSYYGAYELRFNCPYTVGSGVFDHIVLRKSGTTYSIFVNGVSQALTLAQGSYSNSLTENTANIKIRSNSSPSFELQDYLLYQSALSDSEIALLYNSGKAKLLTLERREKKQYFSDSDYLNSYSKYLVANWKLDEMSGTRYDSAGFNALASVNSVGYTADATFGNVATFLASSSRYLSLASNPITALGTTDHTWNFWLKPDAYDDTYDEYIAIGTYTNFLFARYRSGIGGNMYVRVANTEKTFSYSPNFTTWKMVTLRRTATVWELFIDGASQGTIADAAGSISQGELQIGGNTSVAEYLDGKMSSLVLYSTALDATAITALYNSGAGRKPSYDYLRNGIYGANHLIASWPMQETTGTRVDTRNGYQLIQYGGGAVPGYTTGKTRANCMNLTGSERLIWDNSAYDLAALQASGNWSMLWWFKTTATANQIMLDTYYSDKGVQIDINGTTAGRLRVGFYGGTPGDLYHNGSYNDGNWHRACVTASGTLVKLYVDGELRTTGAFIPGDSGQHLFVGQYQGGGYNFVGQLQELDILDIAVDETFIDLDYNSGTGWFYRYST